MRFYYVSGFGVNIDMIWRYTDEKKMDEFLLSTGKFSEKDIENGKWSGNDLLIELINVYEGKGNLYEFEELLYFPRQLPYEEASFKNSGECVTALCNALRPIIKDNVDWRDIIKHFEVVETHSC